MHVNVNSHCRKWRVVERVKGLQAPNVNLFVGVEVTEGEEGIVGVSVSEGSNRRERREQR